MKTPQEKKHTKECEEKRKELEKKFRITFGETCYCDTAPTHQPKNWEDRIKSIVFEATRTDHLTEKEILQYLNWEFNGIDLKNDIVAFVKELLSQHTEQIVSEIEEILSQWEGDGQYVTKSLEGDMKDYLSKLKEL